LLNIIKKHNQGLEWLRPPCKAPALQVLIPEFKSQSHQKKKEEKKKKERNIMRNYKIIYLEEFSYGSNK
jgi:hypothetical protein